MKPSNINKQGVFITQILPLTRVGDKVTMCVEYLERRLAYVTFLATDCEKMGEGVNEGET